MVDEQNKAAARHQGVSVDKAQARRERQAQSLRRNLVRRKSQVRERTKDDALQSPTEGAEDEPSQR
jgi:hypothetical protein